MKTLVTLGAVMALQTIPHYAIAAPAAFGSKDCPALKIENPTNATLIPDSHDCGLVWVLPPAAGTTKLTNYSKSGGALYCSDLKKGIKAGSRIFTQIERTSEEIEKLSKASDAANARLAEATGKVQALAKQEEVAQINALSGDLEAANGRVDTLLSQLNTCGEQCGPLQSELREARQLRTKLSADLRALRQKYLKNVRVYDAALSAEKKAKLEFDNVYAGVFAAIEAQQKVKKLFDDSVAHLQRIEGGVASVVYDSGWDKAVAELTAKYGTQYQFRKVNTSNTRIFASLVGASNRESYLESMPAILDWTVDGVGYEPWAKPAVLKEGYAFPPVISGSVRLSLMGACPAFFKDFVSSDDLQANDIPSEPVYSISATYQYEAVYDLYVKASFKLYKFYEKIVESSSSGGFFSSSTKMSEVVNKINKEDFRIEWNVTDPDSRYDEAKREEIAKNLKTELAQRVLALVAQPVPQPALSVPPQALGERGAIVVAKGLENTCGFNIYCTGGAWLLRGLDAVFGSSKQAAVFRETSTNEATEEWNSTSAKWVPGTTTFTQSKE